MTLSLSLSLSLYISICTYAVSCLSVFWHILATTTDTIENVALLYCHGSFSCFTTVTLVTCRHYILVVGVGLVRTVVVLRSSLVLRNFIEQEIRVWPAAE